MRIPIFLALMALSCQAQPVAGPKTEVLQGPGGDLKIIVVQGEGALNNIRTRSAAPLIVEVHDAGDKPVAGAEVVFQLPPAGPGGVFNGWMRNQTTRTNAEGRAETNGFTPNDEAGRFNIKATATSGTKSSSVIISQTNTANGAPGTQAKSKGNLWKVLVIVGAAGLAGGIVAATRSGSSTPPTPPTPITVSAGPITIGGPH